MKRVCLTAAFLVACRVAGAALTLPVQVTFQGSSGNSSTPVGWLNDNGLAYDVARGYGWLTNSVPADIPVGTEHGPRWYAGTDPLLDGCIRSWSVDSWQADIPDGVYRATVCCGHPTDEKPNTILINGELILDHYPRDDASRRCTEWAIIEVTGGTGVTVTTLPPQGTDADVTDIAYITFEQIGDLAGAQRLILRQALDGYAGVLDVEIRSDTPDASYPTDESVWVSLDASSNERRTFISFDLTGKIPGGMGVALADLRLWCRSIEDRGAADNSEEIDDGPETFAADQAWDATVTWNTGSSISGTSLGVYKRPGRTADGNGTGHSGANRWYHWDASLAAWLWLAGVNNGVLLKEPASISPGHLSRLNSSEFTGGDTLRPTLVLALKQNPNPPTASIDEPTVDPVKPAQDEVVDFTGSGTDPDGHQIVLYIWDWKDGSQESTTDPTASHAWSVPGTYIVELCVVDELGGVSGPDTIVVWVRDPSEIPPDLFVQAIDITGQVSDDMGAAQVVYVSVDGSRVPVSGGLWSASGVPAAPTETTPATVTITAFDASGNEGKLDLVIGVQEL